jgi:hypothetical protein
LEPCAADPVVHMIHDLKSPAGYFGDFETFLGPVVFVPGGTPWFIAPGGEFHVLYVASWPQTPGVDCLADETYFPSQGREQRTSSLDYKVDSNP